ncbi:MAG: hypothetical protein Q8839_02540 [Candidatus Phytoplasma australasiaticum]|nr:hypothetical protein [Candidatus Phytoplasma australasiaticum]MDV3167730.1 hypothetical protein [Candidatus Phytoplasma australasiaticum]MDV3181095.1 hypothetical protein [Candidatus Phytoplasma australasiaticum]MDV3183344.1 hypothetical protein [Candidatus Phytoplasma australasiaticum]MDV3185839.1 hypothetical protein [Candidatus Phytoplasma australasiaticum]
MIIKIIKKIKRSTKTQKNPSYARTQQHFIEPQKTQKYAKYYQPIINK